jgi:hypothetical protein
MKKYKGITALAILINLPTQAATGFFGDTFIIGGEPTVTTYYRVTGTPDGVNPQYSAGFGTLLQNGTFQVKGFEINTFQNNGSNVTHMNMFWSIDNWTTSNQIQLTPATSSSGNNKLWQISSSTQNLLTNNNRVSTLDVGSYTFRAYFEGYTNGTDTAGNIYQNNGGANYNTSFTVTVPEPSSASLMALGAAGLLALRRRRNA